MQVIGFNFTKISAERKKSSEGKLEVKSNINIASVEQDKVELIKDKDILKFNFEFTVDYNPGIANLVFEGIILTIVEKEKLKEILKSWKSKKIPDNVRVPLFNLIFTKCNLRALQLEEELGLPTHIPMPRIQNPQNNQGYVQ